MDGTYILRKSQDDYQGTDAVFQRHLRDLYGIEERSPNKFTMLLILKKTRVASDILATLGTYEEKLRGRDIVLVVFHHMAPHMPAPMPTQDTLTAEVKDRFSLVVDVLYWQGQLDSASVSRAGAAIKLKYGGSAIQRKGRSNGNKKNEKEKSSSWNPFKSQKSIEDGSAVDKLQLSNDGPVVKTDVKSYPQMSQCKSQKRTEDRMEWTHVHPPVIYHMRMGTGNFFGCDWKLLKALQEKDLYRDSTGDPSFVLLCCLKISTIHNDVRGVWEEKGQGLKDEKVVLAIFHPVAEHVAKDFMPVDIQPNEMKNNFSLVVNILFNDDKIYTASLDKAVDDIARYGQSLQSVNKDIMKSTTVKAITAPTEGAEQAMDVCEGGSMYRGPFNVKIDIFNGTQLMDDDITKDIKVMYIEKIKRHMEELYLNKVTDDKKTEKEKGTAGDNGSSDVGGSNCTI